MTYKNDPLMPLLSSEINERCSSYKSLTPAQESDLLSLSADQKKVVVDADKREKQAYLAQMPNINHAGVKNSQKYLAYAERVKASAV